MPVHDDGQALLAAFSELCHWLASRPEYTSANMASGLQAFAARVQEQTILKPLSQFLQRSTHLITRGGGQAVFVQLALGEAETSPITKAAETYVALGRSGSSPGCAHCRAVMPDTNPIGLIHKGLDTSSWDMLLRCPQCGAYRWLTYETHGFADAPVGGQATREDIRKYQWYLTFESKKHRTDIGALVEEIFHKCF